MFLIHFRHVRMRWRNWVFKKVAEAGALPELDIPEKDALHIVRGTLPTWLSTDLEARKNRIENL